jgi:hypothetical protein
LANWMHLKTFIWTIVLGCNNYLHLLDNWMHSKSLIWGCLKLQKLPTSFGELNVVHKLHLLIEMRIIYMLRRITCNISIILNYFTICIKLFWVSKLEYFIKTMNIQLNFNCAFIL